jgi:hypothetical protein
LKKTHSRVAETRTCRSVPSGWTASTDPR